MCVNGHNDVIFIAWTEKNFQIADTYLQEGCGKINEHTFLWDSNSVPSSFSATLTVFIQMRVTHKAQAICIGSSLILVHQEQRVF